QEYAEGGLSAYRHRLLGETHYPNVVLSRGLIDIDTQWSWFSSTSAGFIKRKHASIIVCDSHGYPGMWWDLLEALPVKWSAPSFKASQGGQVAVESIELVHKGISKPALSQALSAAHFGLKLGGVL